MAFDIQRFDPRQGTAEEWQQAFAFRREMHKAVQPDDPYLPDEAWKQRFLLEVEDDTMDFVLLIAWSGEEIAGISTMAWMTDKHPGYAENRELAFVSIEVLPRFRKQGLGRQLLGKLYPLIQQQERSVLIGGSIEQAGRDFAKGIGAKEGLSNVDNRLVLSEVDWSMVEQWSTEGRERNPETVIEEFDEVPEDRLDAYVKAFDSTLRQVPTGELEMTLTVDATEVRKGEANRKKLGSQQLKLVTSEPDGTISGLTWLTYHPELPTVLNQGLTGVMEAHRGRGLGKWLKAEALLRARERFSEVAYIKTDNATSNAPMISINERLGFREFRRSYNLQANVESVGRYLS